MEVKKLFGNAKDLQIMLGTGYSFSKDTLHRFRSELDVNNGGFVHYPPIEATRVGYKFNIEKMENWILENEGRIFSK